VFLNEDTLIEYIRFFFHVVRGRLGAFHIVENADDFLWIDRGQAEREGAYAACADKVRPPRIIASHVDGRMQAKAHIQFKDALFESTVAVTREGLVELLDEDLIIENLPVRPPALYFEGENELLAELMRHMTRR
jgi:hypothetical protein